MANCAGCDQLGGKRSSARATSTSTTSVSAAKSTIWEYRISPATGKLTPMSPARVKTPGGPGAIAVAPDGKYAYVADVTKGTADNVLQYRINARTGALSSRPVATVVGGRDAQSVTIAPDGKSAYVTDPIDGTVWQYRVSSATGRLSLLSPATVPTGVGTHDLVVAPDGKNAYVVTVLNHTVSQYRINAATGVLSRSPASSAGTVRAPELIVLAPDGKNAYVTGDIGGDLSQYAISPATGKITSLSPATVTTPPGGSLGLAVTPDADLAAKVNAPATARHAETLSYTIKITNVGPSEAWRVALTDHLPSTTAFRNAKNTRGHCSAPKAGTSGATVRCHLAKLKVGAAWRIQINVTAKASRGTIRDKANVTSVTPDPRTSNNTATTHTKITK